MLLDNKSFVRKISDNDVKAIQELVSDLETEKLRKKAFIYYIALNNLFNYLKSNKLPANIDDSLCNINLLLRELDIADIKVGNIRLDARIIVGDEYPQMWIPKSHFALDVCPEIYVGILINEKLDKAAIIGFIESSNVVTNQENEKYYIIDASELKPIVSLKKTLNSVSPKIHNYSNDEHGRAEELFVSYKDNEISRDNLEFLIKHLAVCDICRYNYQLFYNTDKVLMTMSNDDETIKDHTLNLFAGDFPVQSEEVAIDISEPDEAQEDGEFIAESNITDDLPLAEIPVNLADEDDFSDIAEISDVDLDYAQEIEEVKENYLSDTTDSEFDEIAEPINLIEKTTDEIEGLEPDDNLDSFDDFNISEEPEISLPTGNSGLVLDQDIPMEGKPEVDLDDIAKMFGNESPQDKPENQSFIATNPDIDDIKASIEDKTEMVGKDEDDFLESLSNDGGLYSDKPDTNANNTISTPDTTNNMVKPMPDIPKTTGTPVGLTQLGEFSTENTFGETNFEFPDSYTTGKKNSLTVAAVSIAMIGALAGTGYFVYTNLVGSNQMNQQNLLINQGSPAQNTVTPQASIPQNNMPEPSQQPAPSPIQSPKSISTSPTPPTGPIIKPENINEAMAGAFSMPASTVKISNISWEVGVSLANDPAFKKYLMLTGQALKLSLSQNLLTAKGIVTNKQIKVQLMLDLQGNISQSEIIRSSGSSEVDDIVLQTIKETANYTKLPQITTTKPNIKAAIIINL